MRQVRKLAAVAACALMGGFMSFAQPGATQQPVKVLTSMVPSVTKLQFDMQGFNLVEVNTPQGVALIPTINEGVDIRTKGYPMLPMVSRSIAISDTQDMTIEVVSSKFTEQQNVLVAPSKGGITRDQNPDLIPYEFGAEYSQNKFFPESIVELADPFILRDVRGQSVMFSPVQYNPVTKTLRIYSEITIAVRESGKQATINAMPQTRAPFNSEFIPTYERIFLNYDASKAVPAPAPEHANGRMIVIAPSKYVDAVQPLVDWKIQRGMNTIIKKTEDIDAAITATKIKNYIKTEYEKTGVEPLTYVLLIGDAADVPALKKSGFDTDQAYGQLVGTDSYNEIFIGRFSAETVDQLKTQVERTIHYEKNITAADDFLGRATGIASNEGGGGGDNGESDSQHMNVIRTALLAYGYNPVSQLYDTNVNVTPAQVVTDINGGTSLMNYVGHGSDTSWVTSNFGNNHMSQLNNFNKLPFIISVACVNGNFVNRTCFAEAFLRSQKDGKPTGAVAMLASTMNQPWAPPMRGQDEMNNILMDKKPENIKKTFGGITTNGLFYMIDKYPTGGSYGGPLTADTWTCFGDPSLLVRTLAAKAMTVSHATEIAAGATSFVVNCDADGALVAIAAGGKLLGRAVVEGGKATVNFDAPYATTVNTYVTVTGFNKVTYSKLVSEGGENPDPDPDPEYAPVTNLQGSYADGKVKLTWTAPVATKGVVLEEGFESGVPSTWTHIDADGDSYIWEQLELFGGAYFDGHESVRCIQSASWKAGGIGALHPNNYLVTPELNLPEGGTLTFWVCGQDADWAGEHYAVYASKAGNAEADFTTAIHEETMTAKQKNSATAEQARARVQGSWYERSVTLPAGTKYVAFRHFNSSDMFYLNLDDIKITTEGGGTDPVNDWTYNVYREGTLLNNVATESYEDAFSTPGVHKYEVEVKYPGGVSPKVAVNVTIPNGGGGGDAQVIMEAHDVWGDGTGYILLLDKTASMYGVEIPESGPLVQGCDVPSDLQGKFSHIVPTTGIIDCAPAADQWIVDGEASLSIPAGTYDYCIINPQPGVNVWIAGSENGRGDNFVIESGKSYRFIATLMGTGDGIEIVGGTGVEEAVASSYKVYGIEGYIVIEAEQAGKANVYDVQGRRVATQQVNGKAMVPAQAGIYIVQLGKTASKVVVK